MKILLPLALLVLLCQPEAQSASWTALTNTPPSIPGTMLLLPDGTVMVQTADRAHWMSLTPDKQGGYINGTWATSSSNVMSKPRLYFASQVLQSGKVWVLGGEYTGLGSPKNFDATAEIFDPATNRWTTAAPYPNQTGCGRVSAFAGSIASGSPIVSNIDSTAGWRAGMVITGSGIPAGTTVASVDSTSQIHLSANATRTGGVAMTLTTQTTGNTVSGSTIITGIPSTAGYLVDWGITGASISSGAAITSVDSASQVHISALATTTATSVPLTLTLQIRPNACFGDGPSALLPGGKILTGDHINSRTLIYDIATDTWSGTANKVNNDRSDEEGWVKLADGSILTYEIFQSSASGSGYAERYDPATNRWFGVSPADGTAKGLLPLLSGPAIGSELGPLLRLYDDRIFVIGGNGHTALYTPSTNTWAAGPDLIGTLAGSPFLFAADDAAAAILPNGHVILAADGGNGISTNGSTISGSDVITGIPSTAQLQVGWAVSGAGIPTGAVISSIDSGSQVTMSLKATATGAGTTLKFGTTFSIPGRLFDFDPQKNTISPVSPALPDNGALESTTTDNSRMLMLPTGQLLFSYGKSTLWIYTPDGAAATSLLPSVGIVTAKGNGAFTLSGTQLSGQSAGAAYGDDVQTDENFPIIRFVNASGNVYYARSSNWSYTGVAGGGLPQTVDFTLNPAMGPGTYSMIVSAAGLSSDPVTVTVSADLSKVVVTPAVVNTQDAESARTSIVSGQWTAIYGHGLANTTRQWNNSDFTGGITVGSPLPTSLDGVSVTIGGKTAPVYYISPTQIDVQAPSNLPAGPANVVVTNNGLVSATTTVIVVQSSPSWFSYAAGSNLFAAAIHLNGKLIGDPAISGAIVEPAHPGEIISLYANGLAPSTAGVIIPPSIFESAVTVTAGSQTLKTVGAALVSAGQFQVNVQLPTNMTSGNYALTLTVPDGSTSTAGVPVVLPVGN